MPQREEPASIAIYSSSDTGIKASRVSVATVDGKSRYPAGQQRKWLHVDADGVLTCVAADKHTLVCTLGIPLRDLRILDPLVCFSVEVHWTYGKASILCMSPDSSIFARIMTLCSLTFITQVASSYPTCIFVREKALLVSLERLRMIISKDQCIILSAPQSPLLPPPPSGLHASPEAPFVKELVRRLKQAADRYVSACAATVAAWECPLTDCMDTPLQLHAGKHFALCFALRHRLDGRDVM